MSFVIVFLRRMLFNFGVTILDLSELATPSLFSVPLIFRNRSFTLLRDKSHCAKGDLKLNLNNEKTFSIEIWTQSRQDH